MAKHIFAITALMLMYQYGTAITVETVTIGNPGNPADTRYADFVHPGGFGSVTKSFRIGQTEITNAQYVEFLNSVAASDPFGLYPNADFSTWSGILQNGSPGTYTYTVKPDAIGQGPDGGNYSYANKPVVFVSWFSVIRFVNWLNNGEGNSDTETGAYTLIGATAIPSNWATISRNPNATWWLPDEDEWYKAAYYDPSSGTYFDYPTHSNTPPNNNLPAADTGNSANFSNGQPLLSSYTTGNVEFPFTDVGAYLLSKSAYGTLDQTGNVDEWVETSYPRFATATQGTRGVRGGNWNASGGMHAAAWGYDFDSDAQDNRGFRVATIAIPEPQNTILIISECSALLGWHLQRLRNRSMQ